MCMDMCKDLGLDLGISISVVVVFAGQHMYTAHTSQGGDKYQFGVIRLGYNCRDYQYRDLVVVAPEWT